MWSFSFHPLHCADAATHHSCRGYNAGAALEHFPDALLDRIADTRPTKPLASRHGSLKTSVDALSDHASLKLSEGAGHLKH
jgi:hypothetical protein